jgi:ubiquinone/menaquinone biosynthesis C-methylase UbiE
MNNHEKEKFSLICPSCKKIKLEKKENIFCCRICNIFYNFKEDFPVLIDFNLENVLIKEHEINIKKTILKKNKFKNYIYNFIYGTSNITKQNVNIFLNYLQKNRNKKVLVIGGATKGSGTNQLWNCKNIDITSIDIVGSKNVDYIVDAHHLPFEEGTFNGVLIQAVLEHVLSPEIVVKEIFRVLDDGGFVYSETPFMQQIHMGKNDFTRYTASGHRYLFKDFEKINIGVNGGPGTSLAWSIKYFFWSLFNEKVASYLAIIPFLILRQFDKFLSDKMSWDSSSGFYFFGKKNNKYKFNKDELNQTYKGNQI